MRYVVGYRADEQGSDAIALAVTLARTRGADLHLVSVVREVPVDDNDDAWWALSLVPNDITARYSTRRDASFARGLILAGIQDNALLIVVGAASGGVLQPFTVGAVAQHLLRSSPIPVALAPRGYRSSAGLTRLTVMVGMREGWQAVLRVATAAATRLQVPLRLISVVEMDRFEQRDFSFDHAHSPARQHVATVLTQAARQMPADQVSVMLARGDSMEEAIADIPWNPEELVIVGSSRLAKSHTVLLGATAQLLLRALPVPLVVVPRD